MSERITKNKKRKAKKKHGFMKRNKSSTGKRLIKRRRLKGRKRIS